MRPCLQEAITARKIDALWDKMPARNLYIAAAIACMTGGLFGYAVGYIGGILVLPSFLRHFGLDQLPAHEIALTQSKIVSSWLIGCVIGVPSSLPICSKYGRKFCITFSASLYIIGAVLQLVNINSSINVFQLGRLINGIGVGAGTLVSPLYISEISPASERGPLISGYQVAIQIFALIGFWGAFVCNSIFSGNLQWQIPVAVQFLPGCILLAGGLLVLPESPQWLIGKGKTNSANNSLLWLRMDSRDTIATELRHLQVLSAEANSASEDDTRSSFARQMIRRPLRKRMAIGIGLMVNHTHLLGFNILTTIDWPEHGWPQCTKLFRPCHFRFCRIHLRLSITLLDRHFWIGKGNHLNSLHTSCFFF